MFVKICGITSIEDAQYCVDAGVDAIGLVFAESSRNVSAAQAKEIVSTLPENVLSVGVFRGQTKEEIVDVASQSQVGCVQLHGDETLQDALWIAEKIPKVIKALSSSDLFSQTQERTGVSQLAEYKRFMLMIDAPNPGAGEPFDWTALQDISTDFILAGGLTPQNVAQAIEIASPWGVDVSTGVELSPGVKDKAKIKSFTSAARS